MKKYHKFYQIERSRFLNMPSRNHIVLHSCFHLGVSFRVLYLDVLYRDREDFEPPKPFDKKNEWLNVLVSQLLDR